MPVNLDRFLGGKPLLAVIFIVSEQLFFLGIHRYNRLLCRQGPLNLRVDVTELRIAAGMIRSFLRLSVALQTVALIVQKLRHFHMTYWVFLSSQLRG